ncbi:methionine aminotransferase [Niabella ginsengisoli]|uniref:Methionine aminotransferase n=1 Tax=Niabella ginsengisoli TaxID=522298 RepID=A0ABS9SJB2_9BACT|nr:methionine aminotransferase [Niabella ginsengisoli]MCH5598454.1 methionine aminotransferase [Niabella ginsengisoli]
MSLRVKHTASPLNIFTIMTNLARQENAYNLSQGLPDYEIASELSEYLHDAVLKGFNQYAPMQGLISLREEIAKDLNERYKTDFCSADLVTVTPGATYGIYTSLTAIIEKGDEVIYFEPAFDCYLPAIEINGGVPVKITLNAANSFAIDWQKVKDSVTTKTRVILVNTPHNPTGYVWSQNDWDELAAVIGSKDIYVISDEVYDSIVFDDDQHLPGFLQHKLQDKLIAIYSFGKAFHITGWKIGYCVASKEITEAFKSIHQYLTFSVNAPAQYALSKYLETYQKGEAAAMLQHKRNLLLDGLKQSKFKQLKSSSGTYFQLYDYSAISDLSDVDFAKWLTIKYKVATIPLSAFYKTEQADKIVRVCFAKKDEVLMAAVENLCGI